jgi:negative regulator of flagellin synthesis FlgM
MADPIQGVTGAIPIEVAQTAQTGTPPTSAQAAQSSAAATVDSADVARAEALLATISTTAKGVPGIDLARVTVLQQAIQSGGYQVNPEQIARKIMELEALLAPQGGGE